jgi:very-short-patch-repair endonuclease
MTAQNEIEETFWQETMTMEWRAIGLRPQFWIIARGHHYRLDFAVPYLKIGIEIDGFDSHSDTSDIAADRKRQRDLEFIGWTIIRFGGQEVYDDPSACAEEALKFIKGRQVKKRKRRVF